MPAANNIPTRRESLNLRIKPAERDLIDRAAKARGKNRTEFVLEAARAAAEEALIEQRQAARKAKDFKTADAIRDKLHDMGIVLEDTPQGVKWRRA